MNRRDFIRTAAIAAASCKASSMAFSAEQTGEKKPNILFIMTDQQAAHAMSCTGNRYLKTPAMDSLAANGTRFDKAYVTQPLCTPFRASLQTGRYPHEIGVISNKRKIQGNFPMLGKLVSEAGYETAYVGKWHVGASFKDAGYTEASNVGLDDKKTTAAISFLKRKHDRPFFLTVSYMNPHNVCELARGEKLPDGPIGPPPADMGELPPLPENFDIPAHEPPAIRVAQATDQRHFPTQDWDELKWLQYLWGYYRLVEKVDAEIGRLLAGLRERGHERATVVIFVSDHGEGMAMHHWNQKYILYDQATRIPMTICWPDKTEPQVSDELVSPALDIPVTILDLIGIDKPASMPGLSLLPLVRGKTRRVGRDYVVAETMFAQGKQNHNGLRGRMIRTKKFKYCVYDEGENREQLFDMTSAPRETKNLAVVADYRERLNRHRKLLADWAEETKDRGFPFVKPSKD